MTGVSETSGAKEASGKGIYLILLFAENTFRQKM